MIASKSTERRLERPRARRTRSPNQPGRVFGYHRGADDALHTYDYKYLADGHLLEILNVYGQRFTLGYDPVGRMTQRRLANGVTGNRTFDAAGCEILRTNLKPAGSALGVYTATWDRAGNPLAWSRSVRPHQRRARAGR